MKLPIEQIITGARHRRDMGDIDGLAQSMSKDGLLHPIVIRPDGTLIAGERRLRAAQSLGWTNIRVTVVDIDALRARRIRREHFSQRLHAIGSSRDQAHA